MILVAWQFSGSVFSRCATRSLVGHEDEGYAVIKAYTFTMFETSSYIACP